MSIDKSKATTIPATMVHRHFGEVVRRVYGSKEHLIVEKDGLPVMAILSMPEYEALMQALVVEQRAERSRHFEEVSRQAGPDFDALGLREEQLLDQMKAIRHDLYQERYGDEQGME